MVIITQRLRMRPWRANDLADLLRLNGEPEVNRWLGGPALAAGSQAALDRYRHGGVFNGYGVLHISQHAGPFIGLAGVQPVRPEMPTYPAVEAVWRFSASAWGRGFALEALTAIMASLPAETSARLIAAIAQPNVRSARLAERLGFEHDPSADYIHPDVHLEAVLRPHRVFRLTRR